MSVKMSSPFLFKIIKNKMKKTKLLWLDDTRNPFEIYKDIPIQNVLVIWIKSYNQFTDYITTYGLPDVISFDYDLTKPKSIEYRNKGYSKKEARILAKESEKNGYYCLMWLIEYCKNNKLNLPKCNIHTLNPNGRKSMEIILEKFI